MAVSMATGQQIEKITMDNLFLGDYRQAVNVSSKSVNMRAQSCLVLTENDYQHLKKSSIFEYPSPSYLKEEGSLLQSRGISLKIHL